MGRPEEGTSSKVPQLPEEAQARHDDVLTGVQGLLALDGLEQGQGATREVQATPTRRVFMWDFFLRIY